MKTLFDKKSIIESTNQLTEIFESGFTDEQNIGLEYEKIPVKISDNTAVEYFFKDGILDFLNMYKNSNKLIDCYENDFLMGLVSSFGNISLEPGSQVELSLKPLNKISDIENFLNIYNRSSSAVAEKLGIKFLALGLQPVSIFNNIKIIPKKRYEYMTKFFRTTDVLPYSMMRETAGVQVSIDYKSEEDAIRKFSVALKLSPFLSAFYSNSPIRNGKISGYKSFRANAWLNTDSIRCGLVSSKLFDRKSDFTFQDYSKILLEIPAIFHKNKFVGKKTFGELLNENVADFEDWQTHISLFFPDVRLKNYIEIRNHDCQKPSLALSIPALYKGIFYSEDGIEKIEDILKDFSYYDFEFVRQNAPKFGIDFSVNNIKVSDIVKEIFAVSEEGLLEFGEQEHKYLDPALELLQDNITPADIIIRNFDGSWNKDIKKLIDYSEI